MINDMLKEREQTHGKAEDTFFVGAKLTEAISTHINLRRYNSSYNLWESHDYAVLGILNKIARIICGNYSADHWDDIIGYAKLGKDLHEKDSKSNGENNSY